MNKENLLSDLKRTTFTLSEKKSECLKLILFYIRYCTNWKALKDAEGKYFFLDVDLFQATIEDIEIQLMHGDREYLERKCSEIQSELDKLNESDEKIELRNLFDRLSLVNKELGRVK